MRQDRLWQLGGAFCALIVVAFGYFFFIRPEYNDTADVNRSAEDARVEVTKLRKQMAELSQQAEHLDDYTAKLAILQAALPENDAAAELLRELQIASEQTGVAVSAVNVGAGTDLKALGVQAYALPVSLTVGGPTAKMNAFLDQLQKVQPRAVLIDSVNFAPSSSNAADAGKSNVTINLSAFYAPSP
jgi:Tfp pilus assembly protein PilO